VTSKWARPAPLVLVAGHPLEERFLFGGQAPGSAQAVQHELAEPDDRNTIYALGMRSVHRSVTHGLQQQDVDACLIGPQQPEILCYLVYHAGPGGT
jgi:hypothetical protein